MITDAIISVIIAPIYAIFKLISLPVVDNIVIPTDVFNGLSGFLANVAYVLPVKQMLGMITFSAILDHFTTIWSLILRIKSFIPTMGH